jgi:hypothetical protein
MRSSSVALPLLAALPGTSAQLHQWAKAAGFLYYGAATDTPGQRERAGWEASYPQYDAILADNDEFGQTTPTNGQKVRQPNSPPTAEMSTASCSTSKLAKLLPPRCYSPGN